VIIATGRRGWIFQLNVFDQGYAIAVRQLHICQAKIEGLFHQ